MALVDGTTRYICLFHSEKRAEAAVQALEAQGFRNSVQSLSKKDLTEGGTTSSLFSAMGVPERDQSHLEDGLAANGVLVSLEAPEDQSDLIERIFHKYSADKIDETDLETREPVASVAAPAATTLVTDVPASAGTVIPIAEESLVVGKRDVERGGVRVYRHTVEEPVSDTVDLHSERVSLQYREVNRPATEADIQAGSQEVELIETAEVPVVQKVARVVEEVHVGKVASDHTEVINDTVRHTEVEVENLEDTSLRQGRTTDRLS